MNRRLVVTYACVVLAALVPFYANHAEDPPCLPEGHKIPDAVIGEPSGKVVLLHDQLEAEKLAAMDMTEIRLPSRRILHPPSGLAAHAKAPLAGLYLAQFRGPVLREWRASLESAGVRCLDYLQENTFVVEIPAGSSESVMGLLQKGLLRYVGPYPAEARLEYRLLAAYEVGPGTEARAVTVRFFDPPGEEERELVSFFFKGSVKWELDPVAPFARGSVELGRMAELAAHNSVKWIEGYVPSRLHNLEAAMSGGTDQVIGNGVYDGTGIRVAVDDTGITRTGTTADCGASGAAYHADLASSRIADQRDFQNSDASACDDNSHGTHTAGTIGGTGTTTPAWKGIAPGVTFLIYKDCCAADDTGFGNVTSVLSRAALNNANVSANSWGGGNWDYDSTSEAMDNAVRGSWDGSDANPQYLNVTISSGNDNDLTSHPGTAKNAITVGAMRDGNWPDDGPWCWCANNGTCGAGATCTTRCRDDYWPPTSRICFSNYGPVDTDGDGNNRIKPDVVAPGTRIHSTAANHLVAGTPNYVDKDGTSMSQPVVAGTVALVLDAKSATLLNWPEMIKARILATAVNVGSSTYYGHGMVDAHHAVYDTTSLDTLLWAGNYIAGTNSENDHTFTVPAGFEEVRVYLTWSDPSSLTTEVVNDLDLRIYDGAGTLVASSLKNDETVEYKRLTTGTAGSWRANVRGQNVPQGSQKYGIIAVAILRPAALTMTATAADSCLRPGQTFTVSTTLSNSGYSAAASQIYLDLPADVSSFTLQSVTVETEDPARSHTYTAAELWLDTVTNRYYLATGLVNNYIPRRATWNLTVGPAISAGNYFLYAYGSAYGAASVSDSVALTVDATAPGNVGALASSDHTVGSCSNDLSVTMTWTAATDAGGCGLDGYGISWTNFFPSSPTAVKDIEGVATYTETLTASTFGRYFNIRAVDNAGNWASTYQSWGPFYLDATAPLDVSALTSTTHTINDCENAFAVTMNWTAATDDNCGVDGYGIYWTTGAPSIPGTTKDIGAVTTTTATLANSTRSYYFNIRSVDRAGNWASTYQSWGPFYVGAPSAAWTSSSPVCAGSPIAFAGPANYSGYNWDFGDGGCTFGLRINEVHTGPTDFVEIFNGGSYAVNLEGWQLAWTDTAPASGAITLPNLVLAAGGYVQLIENAGTNNATHLYLGSNLPWADIRGGSASLLDTGATGVDFVRWGGSTTAAPAGTLWSEPSALATPADTQSLARDDSGTDRSSSADWCLQSPTNAVTLEPVRNSNCASVSQCLFGGCSTGVVINEVHTGTLDAVELTNTGSTSVNLYLWTLSWTDTLPASGTFTLPAFLLAPGGFVALIDGTGTDDATHLYTGTNITWYSTRGGSAALADRDGKASDFVRWGGDVTVPPAGTSWMELSALSTPADTQSLARDDSSTDRSSSRDWCLQSPTTLPTTPGQNSNCALVTACPTEAQRSPSHVYSAAGTYPVSLTVADAKGCLATMTSSVSVGPAMSAAPAPSKNPGFVGVPIQFTSSVSGGTPTFNYTWEFGDSSSSTLPNPTHTYPGPGTFPVSVSITDSSGCSYSTSWSQVVRYPAAEPSNIDLSPADPPLTIPSAASAQILVEQVPGATAYRIYSNSIGTWYGTPAAACTPPASGTGVVTLTYAMPVNSWVIVSASDGFAESSVGRKSGAVERNVAGTNGVVGDEGAETVSPWRCGP